MRVRAEVKGLGVASRIASLFPVQRQSQAALLVVSVATREAETDVITWS